MFHQLHFNLSFVGGQSCVKINTYTSVSVAAETFSPHNYRVAQWNCDTHGNISELHFSIHYTCWNCICKPHVVVPPRHFLWYYLWRLSESNVPVYLKVYSTGGSLHVGPLSTPRLRPWFLNSKWNMQRHAQRHNPFLFDLFTCFAALLCKNCHMGTQWESWPWDLSPFILFQCLSLFMFLNRQLNQFLCNITCHLLLRWGPVPWKWQNIFWTNVLWRSWGTHILNHWRRLIISSN